VLVVVYVPSPCPPPHRTPPCRGKCEHLHCTSCARCVSLLPLITPITALRHPAP
jgi:hypothetical protein